MAEVEIIYDWMKTHSLEDMKDIARELAHRGEDVTELVNVIKDFEEFCIAEGVAFKATV